MGIRKGEKQFPGVYMYIFFYVTGDNIVFAARENVLFCQLSTTGTQCLVYGFKSKYILKLLIVSKPFTFEGYKAVVGQRLRRPSL